MRNILKNQWGSSVLTSRISTELTVFGDLDGPVLRHPVVKLVHTGQVLPLQQGQRKLISQRGFHYIIFKFSQWGGFSPCPFGENPMKVCPDALPFTDTHCLPEMRVSHYSYTQQRGFWNGRGKDVNICAMWFMSNVSAIEQTYCAQECGSFFLQVSAGLRVSLHKSGSDQKTEKKGGPQNSRPIPDPQPGAQSARHQ